MKKLIALSLMLLTFIPTAAHAEYVPPTGYVVDPIPPM